MFSQLQNCKKLFNFEKVLTVKKNQNCDGDLESLPEFTFLYFSCQPVTTSKITD